MEAVTATKFVMTMALLCCIGIYRQNGGSETPDVRLEEEDEEEE